MKTSLKTNTRTKMALYLPASPIRQIGEILHSTLTARFSNYLVQTYLSLGLYLCVAFLICTLLASIAYLFSLSAMQDSEKKSEYECGFEPFDSATRLPFDVHFYLVGILFLIFDVELALLFPWVLGLNSVKWFGFYLRLGFIVILSVGFLYEWKRGALIWPSRQHEKAYVSAKEYQLLPLLFLNVDAFNPFIASLGIILLKIVCLLVAIAYFTLAERKIRAAIQRRRGPNVVGVYGLLQPLADGLKLIAKERIIPSAANSRIFVLAPLVVLTLGLISWSVIPFGFHDHSEYLSNSERVRGLCRTDFTALTLLIAPRVTETARTGTYLYATFPYLMFKYLTEVNDIGDVRYGLLVILAVSSLTVYGLIISGWASNSKYAFLGALRSAAQRISYEVSISLVLLPIMLVGGSLNFTEIVFGQKITISNARELFPRSSVYLISRIAETNRTPFDLPEAEAELVAGYNVDYSSIIFARFFLAEYSNRIVRSAQKSLIFLGGRRIDNVWLLLRSLFEAVTLSLKTLVFCFLFVLVRATFPRYRYDQLRDIGWKTFLPVATGFFLAVTGVLVFAQTTPITYELRPLDYAELGFEWKAAISACASRLYKWIISARSFFNRQLGRLGEAFLHYSKYPFLAVAYLCERYGVYHNLGKHGGWDFQMMINIYAYSFAYWVIKLTILFVMWFFSTLYYYVSPTLIEFIPQIPWPTTDFVPTTREDVGQRLRSTIQPAVEYYGVTFLFFCVTYALFAPLVTHATAEYEKTLELEREKAQKKEEEEESARLKAAPPKVKKIPTPEEKALGVKLFVWARLNKKLRYQFNYRRAALIAAIQDFYRGTLWVWLYWLKPYFSWPVFTYERGLTFSVVTFTKLVLMPLVCIYIVLFIWVNVEYIVTSLRLDWQRRRIIKNKPGDLLGGNGKIFVIKEPYEFTPEIEDTGAHRIREEQRFGLVFTFPLVYLIFIYVTFVDAVTVEGCLPLQVVMELWEELESLAKIWALEQIGNPKVQKFFAALVVLLVSLFGYRLRKIWKRWRRNTKGGNVAYIAWTHIKIRFLTVRKNFAIRGAIYDLLTFAALSILVFTIHRSINSSRQGKERIDSFAFLFDFILRITGLSFERTQLLIYFILSFFSWALWNFLTGGSKALSFTGRIWYDVTLFLRVHSTCRTWLFTLQCLIDLYIPWTPRTLIMRVIVDLAAYLSVRYDTSNFIIIFAIAFLRCSAAHRKLQLWLPRQPTGSTLLYNLKFLFVTVGVPALLYGINQYLPIPYGHASLLADFVVELSSAAGLNTQVGKGLVICSVVWPLSAFFYIVWRCWRYWRAYKKMTNNKKPPSSNASEIAWVEAIISNLSYYQQLVTHLRAEITIRTLIRTSLIAIAIELGSERQKTVSALLTLRALGVGLLLVVGSYFIGSFRAVTAFLFNGYLRTSFYVTVLKLRTLLSCTFVLWNSRQYLKTSTRHLLEYARIFTLTALFRMLLVGAANFRSAFRTIVGFSLNLYVLILFDAHRGGSREAGAKYYFLSTFSSGLRIYAIFTFLASLSTLNFFERRQILLDNVEFIKNCVFLFQTSLGLLLTGIFFKLSAFPGHLWAAEVYEGSPDPVTAFFMLPVKIAILSFLFSTVAVAVSPLTFIWQPFLRVAASGSLLWGCFGALAEKNTKRFLAYASINQRGFLLLGISAATFSGYKSTIVYLLIYTVRNLGFLTVFLNAYISRSKSLLYLTHFRGLGQQNWLASWTVAMSLLSRAGIPPLAGFFGKYYLLLHVLERNLYPLVRIALFTSLISTYYYLRVIKTLWFEGQAGRTLVICKLTGDQQATLFGSEGLLWIFILFSGSILDLAEARTQSLIAPNA